MLLLGLLSFFMFGAVLVLVGANQAQFASALSLDLSESGFLGAVLALGLGIGVVIAGPFADRWSRRPLYMGACAVSAFGLLGIDEQRGYTGTVLLLICVGLGAGFYETILNTTIVAQTRERSAAALALVHTAATAGAGLGPIAMRWSQQHWHWTQAFHILGWLHVVMGLAAISCRWAPPPQHGHSPSAPPLAALFTPALLALSLSAFAYVGVENGLTLFLVPWAQSRAEAESAGQWAISSFWIGLMLGRLALTRWPAPRGLQLLTASGLGAALIVCTSSSIHIAPVALTSALAGIVLGPVFPLLMSLVAARFERQSGTAMGTVGACGAAGGFAVPWLIGTLGDAWGVRAAITLLGAIALLISAPALALSRTEAQRTGEPQAARR